MIKKIFALLLSITVIICTFSVATPVFAAKNTNVSVWDGNLTGTLTDGTGATDWFNSQKDNKVIEIYEAKQLSFIAYISSRDSYNGWGGAATTFSGKTIKLMTDIDLNNKQWLPICYDSGKPFLGTFDGNGHKIMNLSGENLTAFSGKTPTAFGLIGTLAGKVENLVIENVKYDLDLSKCATPIAGAICGNAGYHGGTGRNTVSLIENCAVKNVTFNVTGTLSTADNTYGLAPICGAGYMVDFKNTYVKNVTFNFKQQVTNLQYGGFNNINGAYRTTAFENCYLAEATQSIDGAAATDLKWGEFRSGARHTMTRCFTTSNTTETSTAIRKDPTKEDVRYIVWAMTESAGSDIGFSVDTKKKNGGYPLLTMEAVPVYNLSITKNGDKFTASAVFNNLPDTAMLCFAVYDKTTDMLVFADAIGSSITTKEISGYDPQIHEVKAFVWDMKDYTPLVNFETYTE